MQGLNLTRRDMHLVQSRAIFQLSEDIEYPALSHSASKSAH